MSTESLPTNAAASGVVEQRGKRSGYGFSLLTDEDLFLFNQGSHSRAYEFVMGGVTRTVLEAMTVPVFMAH